MSGVNSMEVENLDDVTSQFSSTNANVNANVNANGAGGAPPAYGPPNNGPFSAPPLFGPVSGSSFTGPQTSGSFFGAPQNSFFTPRANSAFETMNADSIFVQKPALNATVRNYLDWDAKQQQLLRQANGAAWGSRAIYSAASTFKPTTTPMLVPIMDIADLETQIDNIVEHFSGVDFDPVAIAARKSFLLRVDNQIENLLKTTSEKCTLWNRQKIEAQSLIEYDAEVSRLLNLLKATQTMRDKLDGKKKSNGKKADAKQDGKKRKYMSDVDDDA